MAESGFHGHGELPLTADINVTSLVDVAFVLLIIFMITAPIMQGGVDLRLPQGEAQPLQPKEGLTVSVDRDGAIFVDEAQLTYEEFRGSFATMVRTRQPTGVYLRGDERASYGQVARVLAVMKSEVQDVGLVLEEERVRR